MLPSPQNSKSSLRLKSVATTSTSKQLSLPGYRLVEELWANAYEFEYVGHFRGAVICDDPRVLVLELHQPIAAELEARFASLKLPHILRPIAVTRGLVVLPWLPVQLNSRLQSSAVSPAMALLWLTQLSEALVGLHSQGIVHGEIAADAIVVQADAQLFVLPTADNDLEFSDDIYGFGCLVRKLWSAAQVVGLDEVTEPLLDLAKSCCDLPPEERPSAFALTTRLHTLTQSTVSEMRGYAERKLSACLAASNESKHPLVGVPQARGQQAFEEFAVANAASEAYLRPTVFDPTAAGRRINGESKVEEDPQATFGRALSALKQRALRNRTYEPRGKKLPQPVARLNSMHGGGRPTRKVEPESSVRSSELETTGANNSLESFGFPEFGFGCEASRSPRRKVMLAASLVTSLLVVGVGGYALVGQISGSTSKPAAIAHNSTGFDKSPIFSNNMMKQVLQDLADKRDNSLKIGRYPDSVYVAGSPAAAQDLTVTQGLRGATVTGLRTKIIEVHMVEPGQMSSGAHGTASDVARGTADDSTQSRSVRASVKVSVDAYQLVWSDKKQSVPATSYWAEFELNQNDGQQWKVRQVTRS